MAATAPLLRESERFSYLKPKDVARLEEAYRFSEAAHAGQTRQSGDPYISHPLAVAEILAGWHLDGQTLMAALLHDEVPAGEDLGDRERMRDVRVAQLARLDRKSTRLNSTHL